MALRSITRARAETIIARGAATRPAKEIGAADIDRRRRAGGGRPMTPPILPPVLEITIRHVDGRVRRFRLDLELAAVMAVGVVTTAMALGLALSSLGEPPCAYC